MILFRKALDVLDKLLARLQASRDETERARTRSQAAEAAQPEIREGKLLLTRVDMTGVKAVLKEIEQRYFRVMKLTEDVSSDDEEIVHVNREVEKVCLRFSDYYRNFFLRIKDLRYTSDLLQLVFL